MRPPRRAVILSEPKDQGLHDYVTGLETELALAAQAFSGG